MTKIYKKSNFLLGLFTMIAFTGLRAQLSGTKTIGIDYPSLAAAITDINLSGVSGPLIINIPGGYSETAPAGGYALTATGTAVNTIVFQKSGAGANPVLNAYTTGTATPGSALQDGVFRLIGSDYVTIDGININDPNSANPATMEYGYALYKASTTDGCQFNTIKNCVITLNRVNNASGTNPMVDGSVGINVMNAIPSAATTVLTTSATAGSNSNNKFYTNTIQNCNIGIALIGFADVSPFSFADTGNDIGGSSSATGNTIINYGGGGTTSASAGVRTLAQYGINVSYNTVNNNNGSGVSHGAVLRGIYLNTAASASASITNNTVTINSGATTSQATAIENASGSTAASNSINITNNLITNCTYTTATSGNFYGIFTSASAFNVNVSSNIFNNNSTNGTSGSYYNIYNSGSVTGSLTITNNTLSSISFSASTTSLSNYNIYNTGSASTATINISNNSLQGYTFSGLNGGSGTWAGVYATATGAVENIQNNTFNNLSLKTTGAIYLIYNSNYSNLTSISSNSIVGTFSRTAAGGSNFGAIYNSYSTSSGTSANIFNNNFSNISNGTSSGTVYMMYWSTHATQNIHDNVFTNISAPSGTGTFYGLYSYYYGTTLNLYNNTFSDFTYGTGTLYGLYYYGYNHTGASINNNLFKNFSNGGSTNTPIFLYSTGPNANGTYKIFNNKITDISSSNSSASGVCGININSQNGGNVNVYNNLIGNITASLSTNATAVSGINVSSSTAATNANIYYNTIYLSGTSSGSGFGSSGIYANTTANTTLLNNIISNNNVPTGSGITAAYRRSSASLATYGSNSNSNLFYAGTPGSANVIFADGTNTYSTLATYKAALATKDQSSISENTSFLSTTGSSPDFLHINPATSTALESGAVSVSSYTTDYDGDIRQGNAGYAGTGTSPDIGADEFQGSSPAQAINSLSITPTGNQCVAVGRSVTANVTPGVSALTSIILSYSFNGVAQPTVAMTGGSLSSTSNWTGAIPVASPVTAKVTWMVTVTDGTYTKQSNGTAYADEPLTGVFAAVTASLNPICAGSSVTLTPSFGNAAPALYALPPAVSNPTSDEDFGQIIFGALTNTTSISSLVGSIGTAAGVTGSYSDFTAFGPYSFNAGSSYPLSLTSITTGSSYNNAFGVYIDYNRNGIFTDAGEAVYASTATTYGPHTETATVTIPATAYNGLTRMRVIVNEGLVSGPTTAVSWGEYEEYTLNIVSASLGGGASVPLSSYAWTDGSSTVSTSSVAVLSPAANTTYSIIATDPNGCSVTSPAVNVTVTPIPMMPSVSNSTLCGVGVSPSSVTGGSSYNWYATPTSTLALQSNPSSTYTSAIGVTTTFYVSSAVGLCESPRAAVTTTVSIPDPVTATTTSANICPGGSIVLSAVQTGSNNPYSFTWDASTPIGSGIPSSIGGGTITVMPTITGVYIYSVTASDGICTTISSVSVSLNNPPVIMATANPSVVCSGANVNLNAVTNVVAAGTGTLGAGSSTSSFGGSPFYHGWGGAKVQYIYTAAELTAQGFFAGNITSLGLNVTSVGIPYQGFAINVGTTTQSSFASANTINGLTQVFTGPGAGNSYLPTLGVNTFNFTTPIYWNGTDNIVVSICWSNATTGGTSSAVSWDTYSSNVGMYIYADSQTPSTVCGATTTIPASGGSSTTTGRPRTFFSGQKNVPGDGGLVWQWNPGAINTNTTVVNPVNPGTLPANQTYTITAYNPVTTCSNVASVTVSVNPLPATPTVVNSIQCGLGIPTAAVNGGTFYNWYATPTSTAVLQGSASTTFTNAISATTDYYVSSYNGICESVRAMVTASVTIPDLVTAISTASAVCPGQSYTLTAVKTGTANTYNYTWTATPAAGSGIPTSVTGATPVVSPLTPGNHSYLVTAVDGTCTTVSSVNVLLNPTPSISASSTPTVVCSSNSVTLNAMSIAATASTAPSGTVSLGTITGGPYRQGAGSDNKAQYLFTAAELTAAGFAPGNITALSFNVTFNGTGTMNNFTIRMGNTSTTSFGTTYDAAPAIVFGPVAYTTTTGLNTHTFSTPFNWNGTSNIVVQVCHDVVSGGGSSTIDQQTIANRVIYSNTSGACALTTGTSGSSRAVVTFAGQVGTNVTSSMNFLWNPGSIATNTAIVNPVNLGSTPITTVYSVTVTNPSTSCTNATTVGVLVNPIPVAPTAFNSIQCGVAVPTASVTGGIGYHWYNAATTGTLVQSGASQTFTNVISTPTDYYVASFDGNCESPRTMVTASVNIPDAVTASVASSTICPNTATTLTVTQTGSTNNYGYTWVGIPSAGSGISTSITGSSVSVVPTLPGTYIYSITAVDGICTAVSTTTLNVLQALTVAPLAVSNPSALCTGGTATLSGTFGGTLAPTYSAFPTVSNPTTDEDFGGVVFGPLTNTTSVNSLVGSIGTAAGTAGAYSNFTSFGPYNVTAGTTYTLSLSSITTGSSYNNGFGAYIDFNRNGVFTDAGEAVYVSTATSLGPHTELALVTIPSSASTGLTRMRVMVNEGLVSGPNMSMSWGEYEEYTLNVLPNVAYTWSDGASVIGTTPTITQTPSTPTTYSFAVIDPNGCSINSLPVTVNINPIPTVSVTASSPTVCANSAVILTGAGATTYTWAPAGGGSVTATVNPSVTTTYTVTGTSLGCSSTNTISLAVTPTPTVIASSSNSVICLGASVTFTASGAVNYTWTPGSASTTTISVTPTVTSTYSVTGEDLGCTTTKTLSVTVNRIPTLTVTPSSTICIGGSKTLNVSGATTYAWSTGSSAVAIVVSPTISSTYTVSGTNSCGTSTATTMVSVASTPVISAVTSNTLLCVGETATLSVSGTATSYSWSAGGGSSSNIVVSPTSNTTYTVTGTSICGTATTTVIQNVSPCTSVQELASTQISLYPNPTTGLVNISMSRELLGGNTKIEVYDAIGKLVIVETLTNEFTKLYTNKLEDGIYIYKVYDNNKIVTIGKLVKQ